MMVLDPSKHPCFDRDARHEYARVHLPVAPECNIQCNFCDRRFDCMNESRPGVTSGVLSPPQALKYLREVRGMVEKISVVGIAGPGDPFANPRETMATLKLVRREDPDIILCVASNGLAIRPYVDDLAALQVSHVTITINAVDPDIGKNIYAWIRDGRRVLRGREAAELLLERQLDAVNLLAARDILVKVNTIVMPGVNEQHVEEVARTVAAAGAQMMNCMPLIPVGGTPFGQLSSPGAELLAGVRAGAEAHVPQMMHCARCRADAVGRIGESTHENVVDALRRAAHGPLIPADDRPYVAVATREGMLVNQHLGEAECFTIYRAAEEDGGCAVVEERPAPPPGGGADRWQTLAESLHDCRAVLVSGVGGTPKRVLAAHGVKVVLTEGLIDDAVPAIFAGQFAPPPRQVYRCGEACAGTGTGCG